MTTLAIDPAATVSSNREVAVLLRQSSGSAASYGSLPTVIPLGQAYFWTCAWQQFERESADALAAGDYIEFDAPGDAIRWLLSDED